MYNVGILMVVFGLIFSIINGIQMLSNYKIYVTSQSKSRLNLTINSITLGSSILLIALGIGYIFIVYSQL